ncbi:MAG: MFS transporter [Paludibacteraceae bacterium]|jgi:GPH family glycoside/pentoside/hexuronide:cation symporter|nr:MFS transporter [Paludibacteraceae bacterium]
MKLSIKEKLGYSLGDTASHFVWDLVNFWLIFYYTDVLHISAGWASAIAILGSIMDAVMDPIVGIWADRTNTRWGKFRPFLLFGCVPFALFAFLAFFGPSLQGNALIAYILPMFVGLRIVYAVVNIPYSSLGAVMTDDSIERAGLNSYRFVAANIGQLIVSGFALYIVYYLGSQATGMDYAIMADDAARKAFDNTALVDETYIIGFRYLVGIFSCVGIILFLISFATTQERVSPPKRQETDMKHDFKYLFKNRPWVVLMIVGVVSFIMFAIQNISAGYYFKYYLDAESKSQIFNILGTVALIIAIPMTKPLVKKFGAKQLYIVCSILSGLFFCLLFFAGKNFVLINIFNCLGKVAYAPAISLLWTMLADTADYGEWKFNRRTTGLCLSAAVFAQKIGWSIGAAIFGAIMSYIHFDGSLAITITQSNTEIMNTIHWMFGIVPGVLYASCALLLLFYNLDSKTMDQMKKELELRRTI